MGDVVSVRTFTADSLQTLHLTVDRVKTSRSQPVPEGWKKHPSGWIDQQSRTIHKDLPRTVVYKEPEEYDDQDLVGDVYIHGLSADDAAACVKLIDPSGKKVIDSHSSSPRHRTSVESEDRQWKGM